MKFNSANKKGFVLEFFIDGMYYFQAGDGVTWATIVSSSAIVSTGWHHIVVRMLNTGNAKLYIDGYLRASASGITIDYSTDDIWIARNSEAPGAYTATQLDEINYFKRQLTDGGVSVGQLAGGEVAELWNGGAGIELTPEAAARAAVAFSIYDKQAAFKEINSRHTIV
jgi:hypothetical protein